MDQAIQLAPGTIDALIKGDSLRFDDASQQIVPCKCNSNQMSEKVMNVFISQLQLMDYKPHLFLPQRKFEILNTANLFLKGLIKRNSGQLKKGLDVNKRDERMMKIAQLERHMLATSLREEIHLGFLPGRNIKQCYQCEINRDILKKWVNMQTYRGVRKGMDERVVEPMYAADAFLLHPADIDFLMEGHIDKQVGRHNSQFTVDPRTKHVQMRCDGVLQSVERMQDFLQIEDHKVVRKDSKDRYFYRYDKGLTRFDPEAWGSQLPIFEYKANRKTKDWRVELLTVVGKENHSWLQFKDPDGNVRNVGFFYKEGNDRDWTDFCTSIKGAFHVGDKHEYMYAVEYKDMKRTKFQLTQEQHDLLLSEIEKIQNDPHHNLFNVVNSNCTSMVRKLLQKVGIQIESKGTISEIFLGISPKTHCALANFPPVKWLRTFGNILLGVFRNLLMYMLGGGKNKEHPNCLKPRAVHEDRAFPSFWDLFKPDQGLFDHPKKVRQWQEKVDAKREDDTNAMRKMIQTLQNLAALPPHIQRQLIDQLKQRIKDVKYQIPTMKPEELPQGF